MVEDKAPNDIKTLLKKYWTGLKNSWTMWVAHAGVVLGIVGTYFWQIPWDLVMTPEMQAAISQYIPGKSVAIFAVAVILARLRSLKA